MSEPFERAAPRPQAAQPLPFGDIRPAGWLYRQMYRDLEHGFAGHLDRLVPDLFGDDIYSHDRLTTSSGVKDLGTARSGEEWVVQKLWWNSETQSNWWDGLIRAAVLLNDPRALERARAHVDYMLDTQDEDGYLGIYGRDLRFGCDDENGELWAQATLMRGLLAWYEASGQETVLNAVEQAVSVTMKAYSRGGASPFAVRHSIGGVEHGLAFSDVVDRLYFLTSKSEYQEYAHWLYEAFSLGNTAERDAVYENLVDPDYRFQGHGVHTYEHLRAVVNACFASDNPGLQLALDGYLDKLARCLAPSGGPIGDEFICGRDADPAATGYEYCSIQELLDSYCSLLHKSGDPVWADRIEWLLFNAGQGARSMDSRSMAYCTADNISALMGHLDMDDPDNPAEMRFKHSPAHQDVAVCCAPNAGRVYPYYVQNMWQKRGDALAINLYGPSELNTIVRGTPVNISLQTQYPFAHHLAFTVSTRAPLDLCLMLRKPRWVEDVQVIGMEFEHKDGYLLISGRWQGSQGFDVIFKAGPEVIPYHEDGRLVRYGPLLFALPLEAEMLPGRAYSEDFRDIFYRSHGDEAGNLVIPDTTTFAWQKQSFEEENPWSSSILLQGEMLDSKTGKLVKVELVPMGGTVLRKVCFGGVLTQAT